MPTGGLSQTYTIDKFDVAGMTLTGITVEFGAQTYGSVVIQRQGTGTNGVVTFGNIGLRQDFTLTAGVTTVASLQDVGTNVISVGVNRNQTITSSTIPAAQAALTFGSATTGVVSLAPGLFSLFQGAGSLSLALNILRDNFAATIPSNPGTYTITYNDQMAIDARIIYTYVDTPVTVPEPLSVALFGAGLLGIAALRRRPRG